MRRKREYGIMNMLKTISKRLKATKTPFFMERSFRSHRNRTRYHGVYQRIRPARTHDSCVYRVVDLGKRPISCSFYLDKARGS